MMNHLPQGPQACWIYPYPYYHDPYPDYRDYELERLRQELRRTQDALARERLARQLERRPMVPQQPWTPMAIGLPIYREPKVEDILKKIKKKA